MLLHRTPYLCIYGFPEKQILMTSFGLFMPIIPLVTSLQISYNSGGDRATRWVDHPPAFTLGAQLLALRAKTIVIGAHDNPSMMDERKAAAGDLVHEEFVEVTPVSNWTNKARTA